MPKDKGVNAGRIVTRRRRRDPFKPLTSLNGIMGPPADLRRDPAAETQLRRSELSTDKPDALTANNVLLGDNVSQ